MTSKKILLFLIFISFLIFGSKWIISYYLFTETTSTKIIFESVTDGYQYFPLVKYLAIFEFNNSFNPYFEKLDNVMLPFYSIVIPSLFYKFIGSFSFIVVEYLSIFLFLLILYKIFELYYSKELSILYSLIIFVIPILFSLLPIGELTYFKLIQNDIFTLRFPRPLITSLYLFVFLYFIISLEKLDFFTKKNFFILGIILATTLSSFYYFFFIQVSILIFYVFYRYKYSFLDQLLKNWKSLLILFLSFIIVALPMFINMSFHEEDYTGRLALINLNLSQKKVLLEYYLTVYLKKEFLIFLLFSTLYIGFINLKKFLNYKLINLFYLFFIGSVFAPLLFILITNKSTILYHYNNAVVILAFFLILIIALDIFSNLSIKYLNKIFINFTSIILIVFCICTNIYKSVLLNENEKINERLEFNNISNIILKDYDLNESTLMTFDNRFMVWAVLNDVKFLNLTNFIMTPKKDVMIEDDLIKAFKFLNLDSNDFSQFIENKKSSWRYINYDLSTFFFYKYMANPIKTFNNSKNFSIEINEYIKKSSPINFQQTLIPNDELDRLLNKFSLTKLNKFNYPNIVVLNKKNKFFKNIKSINNYCKIYEKDFFILFVKKESDKKC